MHEKTSILVIIWLCLFIGIFLTVYFYNKRKTKKRDEYVGSLTPGDQILILNPDFLSDYHYIRVTFMDTIIDEHDQKYIQYELKGNVALVPIGFICIQ